MVGSSQVRLEDRKNLPYTNAVIHEIQRLANIVPMAIPHKTARDVTLHGYFIKEVEFLHLFQEEKVTKFFFLLLQMYNVRIVTVLTLIVKWQYADCSNAPNGPLQSML